MSGSDSVSDSASAASSVFDFVCLYLLSTGLGTMGEQQPGPALSGRPSKKHTIFYCLYCNTFELST